MRSIRLGQLPFRARGTLRVAIATALALSALAGSARAQRALSPEVTVAAKVSSDDLFASLGGPRMEGIVAPLWLNLSGDLFAQASAFSGCESRLDASGNSVNGFAVRRHGFLRLAPQLVLHRFSQAGCAVDAGSGAGLSYTMPLRNRLWLLHSAGFYRLPTPGGAPSPRLVAAARIDLVTQLTRGSTLSVGIGTRSSTDQFQALHFGGSF